MAKRKKKPARKKTDTLAYQVNISYDPRDEIYVARIPELENCHSHGSTPDEALTNAKEAVALWMETAHEHRIPIPEPINQKKFSGKFVLRAPVELHAHLAQEALRHGKSMNEFAVELIYEGLKKAS